MHIYTFNWFTYVLQKPSWNFFCNISWNISWRNSGQKDFTKFLQHYSGDAVPCVTMQMTKAAQLQTRRNCGTTVEVELKLSTTNFAGNSTNSGYGWIALRYVTLAAFILLIYYTVMIGRMTLTRESGTSPRAQLLGLYSSTRYLLFPFPNFHFGLQLLQSIDESLEFAETRGFAISFATCPRHYLVQRKTRRTKAKVVIKYKVKNHSCSKTWPFGPQVRWPSLLAACIEVLPVLSSTRVLGKVIGRVFG